MPGRSAGRSSSTSKTRSPRNCCKGTFQGTDALTVKIIEENGEKKLGFDANTPAAPVVAAAQP